jgi:hypothetical protein
VQLPSRKTERQQRPKGSPPIVGGQIQLNKGKKMIYILALLLCGACFADENTSCDQLNYVWSNKAGFLINDVSTESEISTYSKYCDFKKNVMDYEQFKTQCTCCPDYFRGNAELYWYPVAKKWIKTYELQEPVTWSMASKTNTIEAYSSYLQKYNGMTHTQSALLAIESLKKAIEDSSFNDAVRNGNSNAFKYFMRTYPTSSHIPEIKTILDSIKEYEDFSAASKSHSLESITSYLEHYPDGRHKTEATTLVVSFKTERSAQEEKDYKLAVSTRDYQGYLDKYPEGLFINEVSALKFKADSTKEHDQTVQTMASDLCQLQTRINALASEFADEKAIAKESGVTNKNKLYNLTTEKHQAQKELNALAIRYRHIAGKDWKFQYSDCLRKGESGRGTNGDENGQ